MERAGYHSAITPARKGGNIQALHDRRHPNKTSQQQTPNPSSSRPRTHGTKPRSPEFHDICLVGATATTSPPKKGRQGPRRNRAAQNPRRVRQKWGKKARSLHQYVTRAFKRRWPTKKLVIMARREENPPHFRSNRTNKQTDGQPSPPPFL